MPEPAESGQSTEGQPPEAPPGGAWHSSRRGFLTGSIRRAAYVAPVIWSVSARQAMAGSDEGSAFSTSGGSGNPSLPPPE